MTPRAARAVAGAEPVPNGTDRAPGGVFLSQRPDFGRPRPVEGGTEMEAMALTLTRRLMLALALAPLAPRLAHAAIEIVEAGEVEKATGEAIGQLKGEQRSLSPGGKVFIDDMLRTGEKARLSVMLGAKTRLLLGERTRVKIDRFLADQGGDLVLERGAMLFERPDDEPHDPLTVTTPFGLIVARGTKFFLGPSNGSPAVFVERGLVEVQAGLNTLSLKPGQGCDLLTASRGAPTAATWSKARIESAFASVL
jgi:ferric-dicitrate binding protein FerR (iron transport regulator)